MEDPTASPTVEPDCTFLWVQGTGTRIDGLYDRVMNGGQPAIINGKKYFIDEDSNHLEWNPNGLRWQIVTPIEIAV